MYLSNYSTTHYRFLSLDIVYILNILDFDEVLKKRKMIREYQQDRRIPTHLINKLLRNAHRSPSAGHTQVQEFIIVIDPVTKRKLCKASLGQSQVEDASVLIVVCSNTSRSVDRYGKRGTDFYSIIDGAFASMIILLSAVNEGIGASFVGAFEDNKVSKILGLPIHVRPIGITALGYTAEKPERFERIELNNLVHYERYNRVRQLARPRTEYG
ncbi:MAG: nitroreductase family protein [Nitrososphaeraceae archaeon]